MRAPYRCLYNHELLILFNSESPYQTYRTPVTDKQVDGYIKELEGRGVDAVMICPQAWMTNLWPSKVDPRWQEPEFVPERLPEDDVKYYEKVYQRISRYMRQGKDPVALSIKSARAAGIAPLFSYRMNENHYTHCEDCPTHSNFWREHPEYRLGRSDTNLDYSRPEVRQHYKDLIFELLERYDVEGFECDFMRQAVFFAPDGIAAGAKLMTDFLRDIRQKMDELGRERGKRLWLSVRVPHELGAMLKEGETLRDERRKIGISSAADAGLDVARWDREGIIDMVNISPNYLTSQQVNIRGYREALSQSILYGEMHFITQLANIPGGHPANIHRLTSRECYRTTALQFLDQGADGISLFNFAYTREHSYRDPRRQFYPSIEPPFDVIASLSKQEELREGDQYIFRVFGCGGSTPLVISGSQDCEIELRLPDALGPLSSACLRLEAEERITHQPVHVEVNGVTGELELPDGELFPPLSLEALPDPLKLRQFVLNPSILKPGVNRVTIKNRCPGSGGSGYLRGRIRLIRIELALYR